MTVHEGARFETRLTQAVLVLASTLGLGMAAEAQSHTFRALAEEELSPSSVLTATEIRMAPGVPTQSHTHAGPVFVYVVEGSVVSQLNDEPAVLYEAGDTWFEPEGVTHTMVKTANDIDPALLLVMMVAPKEGEAAEHED